MKELIVGGIIIASLVILYLVFTQQARSRKARAKHRESRQKLDGELSSTEDERRELQELDAAALDRANAAHEKSEQELDEEAQRIAEKYRPKSLILPLILASLWGVGWTNAGEDVPVPAEPDKCAVQVDTSYFREALVALGEIGEDAAKYIVNREEKIRLLCVEIQALRESVGHKARLLELSDRDLQAYARHVAVTDSVIPKLRYERFGFCAGVGGGYDPFDDEWRGLAGALWGMRF
jgi:hypothetical protein